MDKKEFRVRIKYCLLKGNNTVEAKTCLDAEFRDIVPGKSTIKDWYAKFRRGKMGTEDAWRLDAVTDQYGRETMPPPAGATDAAVDARTMNYFSRSPVRLHVNWSEKKWRSPSLPRFDTRGRIIRVVRSGRLRQIPDNIGYGS
ncbi:hypothetical protein GWI33_023194 [Rhynchophorus ferrugineus]|uniref:Mos1 transposase HTH domain-containing protein n=1 Tax=Rhynchophorus ferrugineus TaxID=354439 RepID=A0A834IPB5_RHYFE|nr:hypothetical protein GWI33_023194 [Rhynchophorus ferrugineus]